MWCVGAYFRFELCLLTWLYCQKYATEQETYGRYGGFLLYDEGTRVGRQLFWPSFSPLFSVCHQVYSWKWTDTKVRSSQIRGQSIKRSISENYIFRTLNILGKGYLSLQQGHSVVIVVNLWSYLTEFWLQLVCNFVILWLDILIIRRPSKVKNFETKVTFLDIRLLVCQTELGPPPTKEIPALFSVISVKDRKQVWRSFST